MQLTHVHGRDRARPRANTVRLIRNLAAGWARMLAVAIVSLLGAAAVAGPALATPQPLGHMTQ
jgi:hypothetical protein